MVFGGWNRYPKEWEDWLIKNRYSDHLSEDFYKEFGVKKPLRTLRLKLNRLGYTIRETRTQEQIDFICERYATYEDTSTLVKEFNEKFNMNKDIGYIKSIAQDYGIKRKVPKRISTRPKIGHEIISSKGLVYIKVSDNAYKGNEHRHNYKPKSIYMYEKYHNVKLPPHSRVIFADGNNRNFEEDNLILITDRQNMKLTHYKAHNKGVITKALVEVLKTEDLINKQGG